ncbi:UDP-Glycosyltransferase/glycogen phosphorylase [Setomelanomma holmii]|uniref:UDP-Glycosyltransferase/glycogen phosphorylase n=1 Tax=Setomelanomma holmii TaxID=210430 RepID=A0A9P4HC00_9PLEO|nr:UDP-Glycosyltransferase/glycogen phosphorylase [Setomelanomma holmii]
MSFSSHDDHFITPTGALIHEPTFPNMSGPLPDPAEGTKLKLSATDGGSPASMSQPDIEQDSERTKDAPASTTQQDELAPRPTQQRWATERPKPSAKHSLLGKIQSASRSKIPKSKPATVEFDPYSSSESDSSDDDALPARSLSHDNELAREASRKRHSVAHGPLSRLKVANEHFRTSGKISKSDGRLKLSLLEKDADSGYLAKALGAVLSKHSKNEDDTSLTSYDHRDIHAQKIAPEDDEMQNPSRRIKLNIVIIIIGSRGDIQPFIRIGKILQNDYGHRVRMATHPAFRDFVEKDSGLEFFSIGGNPAELMAFMVKNPGLIPSMDTIKEGEIGRRRAQMYEMFEGMWRACINATDDENDKMNAKMMGDKRPFVADAIIANPPSFAPPHIAEKLGIPLHMMFTFPYTPTVRFPHPLANIKASNVEATYSNFMSYPLVEMMTWQGLGDLINRFRTTILHLEEVSTIWAPGQLYRLKVPYTYMWSPSLIPKPSDWGPEIDVTGFVFLDLASSYTPPDNLKAFLDNGDPPIYIGFGSIVVDDPDAFTEMIFKAVKMVGCRALVSKGWGGFGSNADCPENVFMLENTPHDWLFPRCSAVIHHGGAGTTAIGLKTARPTMIVPFFGDQPFWGAMVSKAKAGAHECIPYKKLNAERLAEGIKQCLTEEARTNVKKIAESIEKEGDGALNAVHSFHRSLPLRGDGSMRCDFLDNRTATWKIKNTNVKLSALAADILVEKKKLKWSELRLIRHYEWNDFGGPGEPVTGVWGSLVTTLTDAASGVGGVPVEMGRSIKKREKFREKKGALQKRKQHQKATLARVNTNATPKIPVNGSDKKDTKKGRPEAKREESSLSKLEEPEEELAAELAHEAGAGFRKTGAAIARFPMNFTLALTQGFHNAPRLYGDETVRRPPRVTGFHSGLRAGRDELVYGVMDGVTGIITQPIRGAKQRGVFGVARGVGYGIGGFVLKDIAALLGPSAYFMKGLDAEYMKRYQPTNYLRRARIAQGQLELRMLASKTRVPGVEGENVQSEKRDELETMVSLRWQALQKAITEEKKQHKPGVIGSLLGVGDKKEGQRVPRKSKDHAESRPQSRSRTTPAAKTEKQITEEKDTMAHEGVKMRLDGSHRGLNRSSTAPITTIEHSSMNDMKPLEHPATAVPGLIEEEKSGHDEHQQQQVLGNVHLVNGAKNNSNEELKSPTTERERLEVDASDATRRPSADTSSENTKVESDMFELPIAKKATEGLENGRPAEGHGVGVAA